MKFMLKQVLEQRGMSQYRLAKLLGKHQQQVFKWTSGRGTPNAKNVAAICKILDCTPGDLFQLDAAS